MLLHNDEWIIQLKYWQKLITEKVTNLPALIKFPNYVAPNNKPYYTTCGNATQNKMGGIR